MILNSVLGTIFILFFAGIWSRAAAIRKNARVAEASGFKVFYSPIYVNEMWWFLFHTSLLPILNRLPSSWTKPWLKAQQPFRLWHHSYMIFEEAGCDSMMLATPKVNMLVTCDPVVMNQISCSPKNVQQDPKMTKFFAIWGQNIGTSDGDAWKHHRRVVNSGFTPSIYAQVWNEASEQTLSLIHHWKTSHDSVIPVIMSWTHKLALHVVSFTFFHRRMTWDEDDEVPHGHAMGFGQALDSILDNLPLVALLKERLAWLPFKATKQAYAGFTEWTAYMKELRQGVLDRLDETKGKLDKNLLESIVVAGTQGEEKDALPEDHALGNIFITLWAGHESSANTMAFTMILLAIYPAWQKQIQEQLDQHFGDRPPLQWDYEKDFQALNQGPLWAVLIESMRLFNVVSNMFRVTVTHTTLKDSQGVAHELPPGTVCQPNFGAAWRNPNRWATNTPTEERARWNDFPAIFFDPQRWLTNPNLNDEKLNVPRFFPFGQGYRHCPGERYAMVEMISVFATIYKSYSVELEVSEKTLKESNGDHVVAWEKTRDNAIATMSDHVVANMNIQLMKELPIRLVERSNVKNHD